MAEIRIQIPDRDSLKRLWSRTKERVGDTDVQDIKERATELGGKIRDRGDDLAERGGTVIAGIRQGEMPVRINWLEARKLDTSTRERLAAAQAELQAEHDGAADALTILGHAELEAFEGPLRDFSVLFAQLKNVELSEINLESAPPSAQALEVDLAEVTLEAVDAVKAAFAGSTAGALAGAGTFAAVGGMASASTGTAITGLSGVAATNATLAWLGGGSLAAGGGGVALGTAVLGGIVAVPVLAAGGLVVRHQGRKAMAGAEANALEVDRIESELDHAKVVARGIRQRAEQVGHLVERLRTLADRRNGVLEYLVTRENDYDKLDAGDREEVMVTVAVMRTLRGIIDVAIIDEEGRPATFGDDAIAAGEDVLATWSI